jgi:hypothetical protein
MRRLFIAVVVGALFSSTSGGCASQPQTLCSLECDCEHCNDLVEEATCADREKDLAVAEAYGCAEEWEAYATCYEEKGKCDEQKASYSTQAAGQCTGMLDTQFPCTTPDDCMQFGGDTVWTCVAATCRGKSCAVNNQFPCRQDSDCDGGADECGVEISNLFECQTAASAHGQAGPI